MMQFLSKHLFYPLWDLKDRSRRLQEWKTLEDQQRWPEKRLKSLQWERLQQTLKYAATYSPHYRQMFEEQGICPEDLTSEENLRKLPVTAKQDIRNNLDGFISDEYGKSSLVSAKTGGSTGVSSPDVSIVLLTFNRPAEILRNVKELLTMKGFRFEIIVVDNCSDEPVAFGLPNDERLKVIRMKRNLGVAGRNHGIKAASANLIVTLDDDVFGFREGHVSYLLNRFRKDSNLAAVNFKVIDDINENQVNWIHHRVVEDFADTTFETYEISEGAVAFSKQLLNQTELYPTYFFISHEGPDLALQLIKIGGKVIYDPVVVVRHSHSEEGRTNWRRYYYDTRNQFWLVARHYPIGMACKKLIIGLGAMLIYSLRDGYLKYYLKAIYDALKGIRRPLRDRGVLSNECLFYLKSLERKNPSVLYMIRKRLFSSRVRI